MKVKWPQDNKIALIKAFCIGSFSVLFFCLFVIFLFFSIGAGSPLYLAIFHNNYPMAKLFINIGCNVKEEHYDFGGHPLHVAVSQKERYKIVQLLIDNGADVNAVNPFLHSGETPLHIAARCNNSEIAKLLIENGAKVNNLGKCNKTPLAVAIEEKNSETVDLLMEHGGIIIESE